MRIKGKILRKLRDTRGESIAETLVALLISSLALMMLAGAISAATRVITLSKKKMAEYYSKDTVVAEQTGSPSNPITLTLSESSGGTDLVMTFNVNSFWNNTFSDGKFSDRSVVSYAVKE